LYLSILNSRLFKFVVGQDVDTHPSEFSVHEDAVAQLSKPLYILTKGNTSEARAGRARWNDVGKETFERFVQFAYTGDYSIEKTEKRGTAANVEQVETKAPNGVRERIGSPESDGTPIIEANDRHIPVFEHVDREAVPEKIDDDSGSILNYPSISSKKNRKKKRRKTVTEEARPETATELEPDPADLTPANQVQVEEEPITEDSPEAEPEPTLLSEQPKPPDQQSHILVADFHTLSYPLLAPRDHYEATCEPSTDFNKDHSYSSVLLSHASLYVLGDAQLIDSLKALALFKLHKTLCVFELDNENIGDITDLARYAYSGEDKALEEGIGSLRELICQYMAIHAVELSGDSRFMNLLAGGGQIVKDFFQFQLQRIH
jgi:hypothetical protein